MGYEPRFYRVHVARDLSSFTVVEGETDLLVLVGDPFVGVLDEGRLAELKLMALVEVCRLRVDIGRYGDAHPDFFTSFEPLPFDEAAPEVVKAMLRSSAACEVGPMAAVAGAVAEGVARRLAEEVREVIVENGGDLYLIGEQDRVVALWAGSKGLSGIGIEVAARDMPCAIATSSGRVGPSVSFGDADALVALAPSGAFADAAATALANRLSSVDDINEVIRVSQDYVEHASGEHLMGAIATIDGAAGAWGRFRLVPTEHLDT